MNVKIWKNTVLKLNKVMAISVMMYDVRAML
jgi:hypothetical protein